MNRKSLFEFSNYKNYLAHTEQVRTHFGRGFRSRLAEAAGCNNAFVSQVLNTEAHFSPEQGLRVSRYLAHSNDEENYFLLLLGHARASTTDLREHFEKQLMLLREKHLDIKNRVQKDTQLSAEAQAVYYSHWYYAAIHMIVGLAEYRTAARIAGGLNLKLVTINKALAFLVENGLLVEKRGEFQTGPRQLHLDRSSPLIARHHSNWRLAAMDSFSRESAVDIHYSTTSTLSKKDAEDLRAKCVQFIEDYVAQVSPSKDETLCALNLDFFKLVE